VTHRDQLRTLITELAVVRGRVTLSSGQEADWYLDLRRLALHHVGGPLIGRVMLDLTADWSYEAVGGLTLGADPVATAMLHASAASAGEPIDAFIVRKEGKAHGLQRRIEGPQLAASDRCLVVEDVVTTGGSTVAAIHALREAGLQVCGVVSVLDRLAGGGAAIEAAAGAPYAALATIDEVYPERPDR
jgi:orotate phosphoribosyltransferase